MELNDLLDLQKSEEYFETYKEIKSRKVLIPLYEKCKELDSYKALINLGFKDVSNAVEKSHLTFKFAYPFSNNHNPNNIPYKPEYSYISVNYRSHGRLHYIRRDDPQLMYYCKDYNLPGHECFNYDEAFSKIYAYIKIISENYEYQLITNPNEAKHLLEYNYIIPEAFKDEKRVPFDMDSKLVSKKGVNIYKGNITLNDSNIDLFNSYNVEKVNGTINLKDNNNYTFIIKGSQLPKYTKLNVDHNCILHLDKISHIKNATINIPGWHRSVFIIDGNVEYDDLIYFLEKMKVSLLENWEHLKFKLEKFVNIDKFTSDQLKKIIEYFDMDEVTKKQIVLSRFDSKNSKIYEKNLKMDLF